MSKYPSTIVSGAHGLPLALFAIVVIGVFIFAVLRVPDRQAQLYLFSAVAQTLGAILGIIVAVTLVATQLLARYRPRVGQLITRWTLAYILLFGLSISVPLFALQEARWAWLAELPKNLGPFQFSWAGISLWGLIICLVLLPVYVHHVRERLAGLKIEASPRGLSRTRGYVPEQLRYYLQSTSTVALNALDARDYVVYENALRSLCRLLLEDQPPKNEVPKEIWHYYPLLVDEPWKAVLRQIADLNSETGQSPIAITTKAQVFRWLGITASQPDGNLFLSCQAIRLLLKAGEQALEQGFDGPASTVMSDLAAIAEEGMKVEQQATATARAIEAIAAMVRQVLESRRSGAAWDTAIRHGLLRIGYIGKRASESRSSRAAAVSIQQAGYLWESIWHSAHNHDKDAHAREAASQIRMIGIMAANAGWWPATRNAIYWMKIISLTQVVAQATVRGRTVRTYLPIRTLRDLGLGISAWCATSGGDDGGTASRVMEALCSICQEAADAGVHELATEGLGAMDALLKCGGPFAKVGIRDRAKTCFTSLTTSTSTAISTLAGNLLTSHGL
jgi:hypothetical protein